MPDSDAPRTHEAETTGEIRNLPVPVPPAGEPADQNERWFARILRAVFGWKTGSIRSDLKVVLEASAPGDTGFSPEESAMLRNILGLRERRVADVMVPRADIVAVQEDIALGELVKVFETAANTRRKRPLPLGLDLRALDLSTPLSSVKILRTILFVPPSMPAIDLLVKMQASRIHLALVIDEYGGTDGIVSIEDLVELIVGDIEDEHDEASEHRVVRQADGSFVADARANLDEVVAAVGPEFDVGEATEE